MTACLRAAEDFPRVRADLVRVSPSRSTSISLLLATAAALALASGAALAQDAPEEPVPVVASVDVSGNQYLQRETLLFYVQTKPGDRYDVRKLREDFRRLWDTGFLDDLRVEAYDAPRRQAVRFVVTERKRIQIVDYRGSKELTNTNIEDELKKREAQIKIDTFYDRRRHARSSRSSRRCWPRRAGPSPRVKHEAKVIGGSGQQLSFVIDEGPKAKVKEIVFDGNSVFSDAKLRGVMKNIKQPGSLEPQLAGRQDHLHRGEVARWRGREGPERRPRPAGGLLPQPRLRHGADRAAEDHVHGQAWARRTRRRSPSST